MTGAFEIKKTYQAIRSFINKTPLEYAPRLSHMSGANTYLKMEQHQITGSFKARGVFSKMMSLKQEDFKKMFVAASTGNHAAAFGYASHRFGFEGTLFLPKNTDSCKINPLKQYQIEIIFFGDNSIETEAQATFFSKKINGILIHPYNDIEIIKGQGTLGIEIEEQLPEVDTILAPVGGGGLVSGLCLYFKAKKEVQVVGCQSKNASEMYQSVNLGKIVTPSKLPTLADASAGGIEEKAITFDICRKFLSGFEIVQEDAIKKALIHILKYHHTVIEPSSALPIASLMNTNRYKGKNIVLVLTGKKVNKSLLKEISLTATLN